VTRAHPFLQLLFIASTLNAQLSTIAVGSPAAIFTSPLSPAFDLFFYQALLFSISSLCHYYLRLDEALRFRARPRRTANGPTAQPGTAAHCWATRIAGRSHSPITAPASHGFWGLKHSIIETVFGSGNRPCAISCGRCLGLSIWWRGLSLLRVHILKML
jgi:hypothetical protein